MFYTVFELLYFVSNKGIEKEDIQQIIDNTTNYEIFYWEE